MKKPGIAIVSVINDLSTDQRVERSCSLLTELGYRVILIGRKRRKSPPLPERPYKCLRMRLLWETGPLFYAEYNLRLFLFLLFNKAQLLVSNDLDTLLPNYLTHRLKQTPLVYDSHEYFTGVPELEGRKFTRRVWESIEKWIFPKLAHIITVNASIAELYEAQYGKKPAIVRNVPWRRKEEWPRVKSIEGLRSDKQYIILQGSGINIDRGAEEAVEAMRYIINASLIIIGDGDVIPFLKALVKNDALLSERIMFLPRMPYEELMNYTASADIGLSLDKGNNINYRFSLPNKLFDYIQAGTPVLASDLPEVSKIINAYNVGLTIKTLSPEAIAEAINAMLANPEKMEIWKENCKLASQSLCWENEREVLREIYGAAKQERNTSDSL